MRISFIIPVYNEENTIERCLDAITSESCGDDEIIVVDNGSTDNSVKIVRVYDKVQLLEKPGITIAALRNIGAEKAQGDILAFIDADCVICRGWRAHVVNTLNNEGITACGSKIDLPANACWIEKAWFSQKKTTVGVVRYINSGNLAIKKTIFAEIKGFNEKLITGEDSELGWRLNSNGYVVFENPDIKAIHLGNPKDLWNFYKQQRWHGIGMFGTFNVSWLDKPFIMTIFFIICVLFSITLITFYKNTLMGYPGLLALFAILSIPVITSVFRCNQYRNYTYMPQLVLLYLLYFIARSNALILICFRVIHKIKGSWRQ